MYGPSSPARLSWTHGPLGPAYLTGWTNYYILARMFDWVESNLLRFMIVHLSASVDFSKYNGIEPAS